MRGYAYLFTLLLGITLIACQEEKENEKATTATESKEISTEVVNNPATADASTIDTANAPKMVFTENSYDFGQITEGEVVKHFFVFTNEGKSDLLISNAKASCGCTVPYYPKEPIAPGTTDTIRVEFNSKGKSGKQKKNITITANTIPNRTIIHLTGDVTKVTEE